MLNRSKHTKQYLFHLATTGPPDKKIEISRPIANHRACLIRLDNGRGANKAIKVTAADPE